MINAVIFDVSGVLIDDLYATWLAEREALSFYGYNSLSLEELRKNFKIPVAEYYKLIGISEGDSEKVDKKWMECYQNYRHLAKPFPEVKDVLSKLRDKKIQLGVASFAPQEFLKEYLNQFGILHFFDVTEGRKNYKEEKSEILLAALSKMKANPKNSVYVGDMEEDIIAGKIAGVITVAVNREGAYHDIKKLIQRNPDFVITDLNDLLNKLFL
jgi:HAD superfamily hydrolase (TIGR01549 family)